jgi:aspartate/methionine/tyrosine aminotransferase
MSRISLAHLEWADKVYGAVHHNLADSAVCPPDAQELGLDAVPPVVAEPRREREALEAGLGERLRAPGGRVLLAAGASEANACVFAGLLEPGDDVLVEHPGYEPHAGVPPVFGLHVRHFERPAGSGYAVLASEVERRLTPRTRLVVLSDLHNPTSAPFDAREAGPLTALAERGGFHLLCDEAYRDADPARPPGTAAAWGPPWLATGSLTKAYGLGGLRLGWIAAPPDVLGRCASARHAFSVEPAHPSVRAALQLLPRLDALRARAGDILARNHAAWRAFTARLGALRPTVDAPGLVTWCRLGEGDAGDRLAEHALARQGLALTPGRFFGDPGSVRVSLGARPEAFVEALEVLGVAYREWAASAGARGGRA